MMYWTPSQLSFLALPTSQPAVSFVSAAGVRIFTESYSLISTASSSNRRDGRAV
jgi:hypothetical protein